jgi:hypothetical protein
MNRQNKLGFIVLVLGCVSLMTAFVLAESDMPYGIRSINYIQSSRPNTSAYPPASIEAEAGNVTEINLTAIATTKTWQGYYGNITGELTLEDSQGYVFYNWSALEPKGEIYASMNDTINWLNIRCFNWVTVDDQTFDERNVELLYGAGLDAADGVAETFNYSMYTDFYTGTIPINGTSTARGATCHSAFPYRLETGTALDFTRFQNTLLTDGDRLVYSTIIENHDFDNITDVVGFDGREHDFEMLVGENGHDIHHNITTTYYFWAEIE